MRIIVISDTHINEPWDDLPVKLLAEAKNADMIVHAGDLVDLAVLEKLKKLCPNVKAVCGNMDSDVTKKKLPQKEIFSAGGFRIGLVHGYGAPDQIVERVCEAFAKDKPDLVIFGHSHQGLILKKDNVIYFNPGSLTDKIFASYNSFGIIEIGDKIEARIIKL
jgi:putative phosphoesterase